jgi:hypothetical protein
LSTTDLQFASTTLVKEMTPEEINRALLDMLAKVNQVSKTSTDMAQALSVSDGLGHTVHQLPSVSILNNSYPMGHLYLHQHNNTKYTLDTSAITAANIGTWNSIKIVKDDINTNGVRLKINAHLEKITPDALSALYAYLRPTGTTWTASFTDFGSSQGYTIKNFLAISDYSEMTTILDCPIGEGDSVDVLIEHVAGALSSIIIHVQQIGVWI